VTKPVLPFGGTYEHVCESLIRPRNRFSNPISPVQSVNSTRSIVASVEIDYNPKDPEFSK